MEQREGYIEHIKFRNPDNGYTIFQLSEPGFVSFDDEGAATFTPDANGKHRVFLIDGTNAVRVREAFVNLCSEP